MPSNLFRPLPLTLKGGGVFRGPSTILMSPGVVTLLELPFTSWLEDDDVLWSNALNAFTVSASRRGIYECQLNLDARTTPSTATTDMQARLIANDSELLATFPFELEGEVTYHFSSAARFQHASLQHFQLALASPQQTGLIVSNISVLLEGVIA